MGYSHTNLGFMFWARGELEAALAEMREALEAKDLKGTVSQMPSREDVVLPIQEAYIVEFCSR